ncbi:MAG: hypothetical protein RMI91_10165 [Gemmatales bacterium]|nr:hypothetical protein [Gemmatales bacterium]MDW7995006.1 hypothetical protein [Gemmatales bacterium]
MQNRTIYGVALSAMLALNLGCLSCGYHAFHDLADPCRLPRYSALARAYVSAPIVHQTTNGVALEQTVWNSHFRPGSSELTAAGRAHLDRLARRQPEPVRHVFVQAAHDLPLERGKEEAWAQQRQELDRQRVDAVQAYLKAVRPEITFHVAVHDPPEVGSHGQEAQQAIRSMHRSATGQAVFSAFTGGAAAGAGVGTAVTPGTGAGAAATATAGNYR